MSTIGPLYRPKLIRAIDGDPRTCDFRKFTRNKGLNESFSAIVSPSGTSIGSISFEVFSWRMATDPKVFTLEEVASHNSVKDCWLVMFGKVYDVAEFMDDHPGGGEVLLTSTGKDSTEDFEDVGHSKAAREQMDKYYIGEIDVSTLPSKKKFTAVQSNQTIQNSSGGDFVIKFLQFLAPLLILGLALAVRHYTRQTDSSS